MTTRQKQHQSCTKVRRILVTHGTMKFNGGGATMTHQEWVTRACDAPLFGDDEKARGTCRSCHSGWTHPNNYPVDSAA